MSRATIGKLKHLADAEQRLPSTAAESLLTPAFKDFLDRAIVPALIRQALVETDLAESDSHAAQSD
jgi:hypothetical protein